MYIYSLTDPETKRLRYIGKTNKIDRRLYLHIYWAKKNERNQHVYNWIKMLIEKGLLPELNVIEQDLSEKKAIKREIYWIKRYRKLGEPLTNMNDGGLGFSLNNKIWVGRKHTEKTKKKMSLAQIGKQFDVNRRIALSNGHKRKNGIEYVSKLDRGNHPIKVNVYDAVSNKLWYKFNSILECARVLNLNRSFIKIRYLEDKPYVNFKFKLYGHNGRTLTRTKEKKKTSLQHHRS